jgi:hypothetical protein
VSSRVSNFVTSLAAASGYAAYSSLVYHNTIVVQRPAMRLAMPAPARHALLAKIGVFVRLFVIWEEGSEAVEYG